MITIRKMKAEEGQAVKKTGAKAFLGAERLFVSKPKEAMVAIIDEKIVGGMVFKYTIAKDKKIAYIDFAYVDPDYHNQSVGRQLYKESFEYLWSEGCTAIITMVKDDNVASWKSLLNNGFSQVSLLEATKELGVELMLKEYFATTAFMSNGMEFYLMVKGKEVKPKKVETITQIGFYLLANFLLLILGFLLNNRSNWGMYILAYIGLLASGVFISYLGSLLSKRKWKFRVNSCGAVVVAFINIGAAYPLIGNWYPESYENTKEFKRDMGIPALLEWIFLLVILVGSKIIMPQHILVKYLSQIASTFIMYRILAIYPFESFGGGRVYRWNKLLYLMMSIISVILIMI
ncbi:GNAT family N-acetyltransferase [Clostridium sp. LP20]|uniref:GNAT family N-acetyltransferase n=1 Tax=Clostridium sp. LP20 TaxID=3418665 RepID=UPI003EE63E06